MNKNLLYMLDVIDQLTFTDKYHILDEGSNWVKITSKDKIGKISNLGFAAGYFGGGYKLMELSANVLGQVADDKKSTKERNELVKYLTDDGYSEQDIKIASYNGKLLSMAVKAMRYDQTKTKSQAALKKVVKVPRIMKPGAKAPAPKPNGKGEDRVSLLYGPS